MSLATYTFASFARRGFQADANATATVTVSVAGQDPISRQVEMMTSGDVDGISAAQVIRSYPRPETPNAEPNYLAHVELDSPDIPWLFSRPGPGGVLHPWVCLAVLDEAALDQDALKHTAVGTQVTAPSDQLPNPAEASLWCHAQLLGADTVPGDPSRSLARLLSPRRLRPNARYLACVVPTTEAAQLAGLGNDPGEKRTSTDFAWSVSQGSDVTLPVYHWYRFSTGPAGDFEALVRRLHGVPLPAGMGRRRLRLDNPRSGLPAPAPTGIEVELHVALRPPDEKRDDLVALTGAGYVDVLSSRLRDAGYDVSLVTGGPDTPPPEVGPPVWGQLPVGATAVAAHLGTGAVPPWLSDLNLDPRLRVAAGLGAELVRRNQDHYLEEAWRQVGDVLAANRLRRRGEYSIATSLRLYDKWISKADAGRLLTAAAPVHAKIGLGPTETIVGRLRSSPLPPAVVSVEFRRFSRFRGIADPLSGLRTTLNVDALRAHSAETAPLFDRRGLDSIDTLTSPSDVWGVERAADILKELVPDVQVASDEQAAAELDRISVLSRPADVPRPEAVAGLIAERRPGADALLTRAGFLPAAVVERPGEPQPPVRRLPAARIDRGVFRRLLEDRWQPAAPQRVAFDLPTLQSKRVVNAFREIAVGIAARQIRGADVAGLPGEALAGGLDGLRATVLSALHPVRTITNAVNSRISELVGDQAVTLDDIMAAPDLSEPTYEKLAAISHDWLLPGIDALPTDTTTLVAANREFIASFLIGINHELGRELLWHEYPTDQRGTYARQFWTHKVSTDRTARYDLKHALHQAPGLHIGPLCGDGEDPLVLVVKGELVRRYPSLLVFAAHTRAAGARRVFDDVGALEPDFTGLLEPDVLLAGFWGLTATKVRDAARTGNANDPWWFFFAEHFAEPRFGFDELVVGNVELGPDEHRDWTKPGRVWNDAAWQYAALDQRGFLTAGSFPGTPLRKTPARPAEFTWANSAAEQAWITLQFPFRRGIKAVDLLPPEVSP